MKFFLLFVVASFAALNLEAPAVNHDIIKQVNANPHSTWKAGINPHFIGLKVADAKRLCGALPSPKQAKTVDIVPLKDIPTEFDPRNKWPKCKTLFEIRDQGPCGSCWAIASAEVMSDRWCIESQFQQQPELSTQDITSCCSFCGQGCNGGYPIMAFYYWQFSGVVTGGPYKSGQGCYPYEMEECEHHMNGTRKPCGDTQPTPQCKNKCINKLDWNKDKHMADQVYQVGSDVEAIQTELMTKGPLLCTMTVFEDFLDYKSGVYQHESGEQLGGHAMKLFGWGEENGTPYWLVANSWNSDWGLDGFIKILRGSDECGIESGLVGGTGRAK